MHGVNGSAEQVRDGRPGSNPLLRFNVVTGNDKEAESSLHMINRSQGSEHIDSKVFIHSNSYLLLNIILCEFDILLLA